MSGRALVERSDLRRGVAPVRRTELVREVIEETPASIDQETDIAVEPEPAAASEDRFSNFARDEFLTELAEDEPETAARLAGKTAPEPPAQPTPPPPALTVDPYEFEALAADIGLGRVRVAMLAGLTPHADVAAIADRLAAESLRRGLSVARIDAGSGRISDAPGLTDLAAGFASFGDVVHKSMREGLAEVPWGQEPALDHDSTKPVTLVEALADIYEVVIVLAGPAGKASALSMFAGIGCRLVFVAGDDTGEADVIEARAEADRLGYAPAQLVAAPGREAQVA
jgi:hypothetical protein